MISKEEMIEEHLKGRGISDSAVLDAMQKVDRSLFVPRELKEHAYEDRPLQIGQGQNISQPYMVAFMAEKLKLHDGSKVLEIGTGCGYNAAVMAQIASEVYSIEIIEKLADMARQNLELAEIDNVKVRFCDGFRGWSEHAPYDAIVLTAAPMEIPSILKGQLKIGGRLVAPVGKDSQKLIILTKTGEDEFEGKALLGVKFVPMAGEVV
ncbi:hypothetical protein GCM10011506_19500 [Marivirga lumbricoides]|uniref:Protein-L-isoaspartate O-methyltransferase n=1 Tax=Marivirga lumbricoides TaxID=1046115 RepID=A0ABQ1M4B2_9BACT|nr:hypothetical protein GCM10011506_19500 [Marivirga lumbricoides]